MTQHAHTPGSINMARTADRVARHISNPALPDDEVRDICDHLTVGDLDCFQLDMLTDMVKARMGGK